MATSGDLRQQRLERRAFGNTRTIRGLLPPGYGAAENRGRRHPVVNVLDGEKRFGARLSDVSHRQRDVDETSTGR